MDIVVATHNAGKLHEFADLLRGLPVRVRSLSEFPEAGEPEETGDTFRANALLKARAAVEATGLWALADDSGLCVDALEGAPGIHSARYAQGSDQTRWAKLLDALAQVPDAERGAAFVCTLALCGPGGEEVVVEGRCPGHIARQARGAHGFGYDPVFEVEEDLERRTMAELSTAEKRQVSHRGKAFQALLPHLARLARAG